MNVLNLTARRNATDEFVEQGVRPGDEFQVGVIPSDAVFAPVQRVAIFAEAFLPKIDGVSKTAVIVTRHLQQTGREVIIFTPDNNGNTPDALGPTPVVAVPSLEIPFVPETKVGFPSITVNTYLDEFRPDIIHLFSPAMMSLSGVWFGRTNAVPIVANYQTDLPGYATRYGLNLFSEPVKEALRALHNQAEVNLVPSHTTIRQLREWGFPRLRHWARGVDRDRFNPGKRSDEMHRRLLGGRPDDSLLVLYVGRLAAEKRVDLLIEAAQLEGVALAIVGDGEQRAEMEALYGDDATFTGYLFGEELAAAYASADAFAFTGTNETFGQVVMEGMASGLPAVVVNSGGVVDQVLDGINGYICQLDPAAFARRIATLRDNPAQRARMAERALEYARQRPWEALMAELEGYYAEAWRAGNDQ